LKTLKLYCFFIFLAVFLSINAVAKSQPNQYIDSLKKALKITKNDSTRCCILGLIVENSFESDQINYNNQLLSICEKQLSNLTNNNSLYHYYLKYKALALNNIGVIFQNKGNVIVALDNYHKSLKIQEALNSRDDISITLFNIGILYMSQKDYDNSLKYFEKSFKKSSEKCNSCPELIDKIGMAYSLNNMGIIYHAKNDTSKAMKCFISSLNSVSEIGDKEGVSMVLLSIGNFYNKEKQYDKALEYYIKCKESLNGFHNLQGITWVYVNIANTLTQLGNFSEALKYAQQGLKYAQELGFPEQIKHISKTLSEIYSNTGKYKEAYEMHVLYKQMNDSILNESNRKESVKKEFQFQYEKKSSADSLIVAEERKVYDAQIKQEKTQRVASYIVIALVLVFSGFMYNRYRVTNKQKQLIELKEIETQQQKHIIEEKHKEITDSINYAERIQRSFLASNDLLDINLNDYFIYFKPKDIVSGDFYWAASTGSVTDKKFTLATADSTGHGVPGAIMSLLNITSLEKAIEHHSTPSEILNHTRKTIIDRLKKDGSAEGGKDGMDCSLIVFDFNNMSLQISCANNPVWIVRKVKSQNLKDENGNFSSSDSDSNRNDNKTEIIEIKPDKMPVGKHQNDNLPFTNHFIKIQKGDIVYTFTDGYADQFGGKDGKKFLSKNLKSLLVSNAHLPMKTQQEILNETFINWIKNTEQIDDVTIVGIRV
jgi:serine phosphatase RsbU (regulator of sigma subunit)/tetratricopeptide (TPR) repeat protein